jgi:hypothetical protein
MGKKIPRIPEARLMIPIKISKYFIHIAIAISGNAGYRIESLLFISLKNSLYILYLHCVFFTLLIIYMYRQRRCVETG